MVASSMPVCKYYDHTAHQPLDLNADGCELAEWEILYGKSKYARHPKGFMVFLPPGKIDTYDEYKGADPYSVEKNINSEFQRRRIEITIDLTRTALSIQHDTPQILDIGCGQGHITDRIRQALNGAVISGLDYSLSAIEYAHEHFPDIEFAVGDAYESPYAPGYFDVVICNNLWEHVPDPLFLLSRIKRIIKPGGHLIVSTPSRYRLENIMHVLIGRPVEFMSRHHVTEYTVGQIKEQLAYGGFSVKSIQSRPIYTGNLRTRVARMLLSTLISMVGSHHRLESTVFYLAQEGLVP